MVKNITDAMKNTMEIVINAFMLQANKMVTHLEKLANKLQASSATYSMSVTNENLGGNISKRSIHLHCHHTHHSQTKIGKSPMQIHSRSETFNTEKGDIITLPCIEIP